MPDSRRPWIVASWTSFGGIIFLSIADHVGLAVLAAVCLVVSVVGGVWASVRAAWRREADAVSTTATILLALVPLVVLVVLLYWLITHIDISGMIL